MRKRIAEASSGAAVAAFCIALSGGVFAQTFTYDFVWYSGARQDWVYEAGSKLLVDVYEDETTPESDVLFRVRNGIDTDLGYESSIADLQIDTGNLITEMFSEVSISFSNSVGYFSYYMYPPGSPGTLIDSSASRVAWTGEYAAGRTSNTSKLYGINPGEFLVFRALLQEGVGFSDVIDAMNTGLSSSYVDGHYGQWTTAEKQYYRAEATKGLRLALLLQSIVPNSWHPDGHGLFVPHGLVAISDGVSPVITALTATPEIILDSQTSQLSVVASDPQPGPQSLSYMWTVISGEGMFDDPTSPTPLFIPADVTGTQFVGLQVDVSDGETTVSATLNVQVDDASAPPQNAPPQILSLMANPETILDTEASQLSVVAVDPDQGPSSLSYQWTVVSGGGVLDDATIAEPVYIPADVVGSQSATLRVEVSDGEATVSGDLTITVEDANPPPPGQELLVEDFSGDGLSGWSVRDEGTISTPSKWRVVSDELAQLSNIRDGGTGSSLPHLGTYLLYEDGLGWTDYRARFKLRSVDDDTLGLMFRFQDNDNYYRFSWDKQLNQRRLVKKAGGEFTLLAADNVPYVQGQNHQVEIVAQGTQMEVWVDGTRVFEVEDGTLGRGSVAFYTWMNNGAYFDDLVVEDLSGGNFNALPKITALTATPRTILDTETSQLEVVAYDPDEGPLPLSYQWTVVAGAGVLDDATVAAPVYIPADVVGFQSVTLRVQVSDGAASVTSDLTLTVEDANPPPLGPELLVDDFSGSTLAGWSVWDEGTISAPSKWRLASGELAQLSNIRDGGTGNSLPHLGTYLLHDGGLGWTDYQVKFKLRSVDDDTLGLMFRIQDGENYYRFSWDKQLNQRRLVKKAGGVFTLLAADNVPYVQGQEYRVEITARGAQMEVWVDGKQVFQVDDAAHAQGSVAFYTWMNNGAYFDDIQVNALE